MPFCLTESLERLKAAKQYTPATRKNIASDVRCCQRWFGSEYGQEVDLAALTDAGVYTYREWLMQENYAPCTINRRLQGLHMFFTFAGLKPLSFNKARLHLPPKLAPKSLSHTEVNRILRAVKLLNEKKKPLMRLRNMLLVLLMLRAGLRVGEVVQLKRTDIELSDKRGCVLVRWSKGYKSRRVPLNKQVRNTVAKYLEALLKAYPDAKYLIRGLRDERMNTTAVNSLFVRYAQAAQIYFTPHMLRHTFARNYLDAQPGDIVGLAQLLGHSNINTTAIYTQNRLEDLENKMNNII